MARTYAGILGSIAMAVVICRGMIASGGVESTLTSGLMYLALFTAVGAILGHLAQSTVEESVRSKIEQQLSQSEPAASN